MKKLLLLVFIPVVLQSQTMKNFNVYRGEAVTLAFNLGRTITSAGDSVVFTTKLSWNSTYAVIPIKKTWRGFGGAESQIQIIDSTYGVIWVKLLATETALLTENSYMYDVKVGTSTIIRGSIVINNTTGTPPLYNWYSILSDSLRLNNWGYVTRTELSDTLDNNPRSASGSGAVILPSVAYVNSGYTVTGQYFQTIAAAYSAGYRIIRVDGAGCGTVVHEADTLTIYGGHANIGGGALVVRRDGVLRIDLDTISGAAAGASAMIESYGRSKVFARVGKIYNSDTTATQGHFWLITKDTSRAVVTVGEMQKGIRADNLSSVEVVNTHSTHGYPYIGARDSASVSIASSSLVMCVADTTTGVHILEAIIRDGQARNWTQWNLKGSYFNFNGHNGTGLYPTSGNPVEIGSGARFKAYNCMFTDFGGRFTGGYQATVGLGGCEEIEMIGCRVWGSGAIYENNKEKNMLGTHYKSGIALAFTEQNSIGVKWNFQDVTVTCDTLPVSITNTVRTNSETLDTLRAQDVKLISRHGGVTGNVTSGSFDSLWFAVMKGSPKNSSIRNGVQSWLSNSYLTGTNYIYGELIAHGAYPNETWVSTGAKIVADTLLGVVNDWSENAKQCGVRLYPSQTANNKGWVFDNTDAAISAYVRTKLFIIPYFDDSWGVGDQTHRFGQAWFSTAYLDTMKAQSRMTTKASDGNEWRVGLDVNGRAYTQNHAGSTWGERKVYGGAYINRVTITTNNDSAYIRLSSFDDSSGVSYTDSTITVNVAGVYEIQFTLMGYVVAGRYGFEIYGDNDVRRAALAQTTQDVPYNDAEKISIVLRRQVYLPAGQIISARWNTDAVANTLTIWHASLTLYRL